MTYQAQGRAWIQVTHHHFCLTPDGFRPTRTTGRASNGLVTAADGTVVVSTGIHTGGVHVEAQTCPQAPAPDTPSWEDIGETSVHAPSGHLLMTSIDGSGLDTFPDLAPAGPGTHRVRVHARGRMHHYDGSQHHSLEAYLIQVWPAAPTPDTTLAINVAYARQTGMTGRPITPFNPPRPPGAPPGPQTQRPQPAPQRPRTDTRNETRHRGVRQF